MYNLINDKGPTILITLFNEDTKVHIFVIKNMQIQNTKHMNQTLKETCYSAFVWTHGRFLAV